MSELFPLPDTTYIAGELLVICGPTASGKSALALAAARKYDGEIVSIDSMQLYRGLEIGTAQPTREEQQEIPHHLVGCFDIAERIDVTRFVELADQAVAKILSRGKLPILAGGTGLYLRTFLHGMDDLPASPTLRRELDEKYDSQEGFPALCAEMRRLDPAAYEKFHTCRRRLIRAMEVRLLAGKSILDLQSSGPRPCRYPVHAFRLECEKDWLVGRIRERTRAMLNGGWIDEARSALARGLLNTPTAHQALGYRLIAEFLAGKYSRDELEERIVTATWQFARRQRTWFRYQHPEAFPLPRPVEISQKAFRNA